jgi:HprK-related kinase A
MSGPVTACRVLDVGAARLAVISPIASFHAQLDAVYPYMDVIADEGFADVRVSLLPEARILPGRRQARLWSEGDCPFEPYPLNAALPLFEWGSNWLLSQRLNAYLLLHAGGLARDGEAVILPAAPGSGKTTLSCALHLAGWRFLSDEFGVVDIERREVLPMVRPAPLKNASIEVMRARAGTRL